MAALAWLVAVIVLLGYEFWAIRTGRRTLSSQMVEWTRTWPLMPYIWGVVTGGLAVHFFWHWCP
jgi:hypothetical protein